MTSDSDFTEKFKSITEALFVYLDLDTKFVSEVSLSTLSNASQHNVLIGVSGALKGNIMFGYNASTFRQIGKRMTNLKLVDENDIFVKTSVVDFFMEFCKKLVATFDEEADTLLSYPIAISGENTSAMISQVPSKNLFFKVNEERLSIAYYLEQG